jgi:hypothetical protein
VNAHRLSRARPVPTGQEKTTGVAGDEGLATGVSTGLTAREGRRFGLTVGVAFLTVSALTTWRGHEYASWATGAIGGLLVLGGLAIPDRLGPVCAFWMGLANLLSKVTTPIFLAVVYFLVFTPFGLVMRLLGCQPLRRPPKSESFWISRDPLTRQRADMERQFWGRRTHVPALRHRCCRASCRSPRNRQLPAPAGGCCKPVPFWPYPGTIHRELA